MCRWAAYIGAPLFLADLIARPDHSLVDQSRAAEECKTAINADGFGLAWYAHRPQPGVFRDVYPAWSDPNLQSIAHQVKSRLFMAHVRASTGTAISRNNCHPFAWGRWSFMHNGQVGGFDRFRKSADMLIPDDLYPYRKGATDSEALFLLAVSEGLDQDPYGAIARAVGTLEEMSRQSGAGPHMRVSAAFSDGDWLYAVRYASDGHAPSLYYRWEAQWSGWAVVSEPFDDTAKGWTAVPSGHMCTFTPDNVAMNAFAPACKVPRASGPARH